MQCSNCHKTGFVIIGNKRYCSNCGTRLAGAEAPRGMSDIKPTTPGQPAPKPLSNQPASAPVPPTPIANGPAKPSVLDLRDQAPTAAPEAISTPIATSATPVAPPPSPGTTVKPASKSTHPLVQRFPQHPAVAKAAPDPLPNQATSQVESLQALATPVNPASDPAPTAGPSSPALQQVMASAKPNKTPSVMKIGAALAAIAIMSGVVWMQNSPKLAFRSAATQAGIDASLPSYMPSSYRQAGPANVAPGQLSLAFASPGAEHPIQITQRRTDWDSTSLRENYVARQSDNYLAVQGQGLTIYVLGDSVNWVNRGIWYTVSGTSKLSREQVLKIAYGL
jgi:hypothetical protein